MNTIFPSSPINPDARWPDGLTIRARLASDAPSVTTLHNMPGYRFGTLRTPYHSPDEIRKGIESQPANMTSLVAVLDGQIVGDIGMTRYANRRAHVASIGMGVHDAFAGLGIGSALLGEVVAIAGNWLNLRRLELTVFVDNEPAIRLYRKFGFEIEGTLREFAFRDGVFVDAYAMARMTVR